MFAAGQGMPTVVVNCVCHPKKEERSEKDLSWLCVL